MHEPARERYCCSHFCWCQDRFSGPSNIPAGFSSPGKNIHKCELPVHFPSSCELNVCFSLSSLPPFHYFCNLTLKIWTYSWGRRNVTGWNGKLFFFFFFAFVKPEILLRVCLFNLLFAVQNLGGKLQNVIWLQMCWCLILGFLRRKK